jgi:hypothetical protein
MIGGGLHRSLDVLLVADIGADEFTARAKLFQFTLDPAAMLVIDFGDDNFSAFTRETAGYTTADTLTGSGYQSDFSDKLRHVLSLRKSGLRRGGCRGHEATMPAEELFLPLHEPMWHY